MGAPRSAPLAATALVAALSGAPGARAQSADEETCRQHYERAQELRVAERPLAARGELGLCVSSCTEAPREDCVRWQAEVAGEIPRLLVVIVDAEGRLVQGATLIVDGHPLSDPAAAGPFEVEPGAHSVEARAGEASATTRLVLERGSIRQLRLRLAPRREPTAPPSGGGDDNELWAIGGLGVAAGIAGAALIVAGHVKNAEDEDTCADKVQMPGARVGCSRAEADELALGTERLWIAGGITAGAGAGLVTAAILGLVLRPPVHARGRLGWQPNAAGHPGLSFRGAW
jgi:hypothetical protein